MAIFRVSRSAAAARQITTPARGSILRYLVPGVVPLVAAMCGTNPVQPEAPPMAGIEEARAPATCESGSARRVVPVSTSQQLSAALADAQPGDQIVLADGVYTGRFAATRSGTGRRPVLLCGGSSAVIQTGTTGSGGYALTLRASYWVLEGFTVANSQMGVRVAGGHRNRLSGLAVHGTGQEAVKFNANSTENTLENSRIWNTGLSIPEYGEGVYVGSWHGHWCNVTACEPDRSDANRIVNNLLGPDIRSEHVDIKEGTTGTIVRGNTFRGEGMVASEPWIESWVIVHGNGSTISENRGVTVLRHGFKVEVVLDGWGNSNTFSGNVVDARSDGYGFRISSRSTRNRVGCDNSVVNAASGFANVPCAS